MALDNPKRVYMLLNKKNHMKWEGILFFYQITNFKKILAIVRIFINFVYLKVRKGIAFLFKKNHANIPKVFNVDIQEIIRQWYSSAF